MKMDKESDRTDVFQPKTDPDYITPVDVNSLICSISDNAANPVEVAPRSRDWFSSSELTSLARSIVNTPKK